MHAIHLKAIAKDITPSQLEFGAQYYIKRRPVVDAISQEYGISVDIAAPAFTLTLTNLGEVPEDLSILLSRFDQLVKKGGPTHPNAVQQWNNIWNKRMHYTEVMPDESHRSDYTKALLGEKRVAPTGVKIMLNTIWKDFSNDVPTFRKAFFDVADDLNIAPITLQAATWKYARDNRNNF